jgi:hypothetical protein
MRLMIDEMRSSYEMIVARDISIEEKKIFSLTGCDDARSLSAYYIVHNRVGVGLLDLEAT